MSRFRSFSGTGIWAILAVSVLTPYAGADVLVPSSYFSFSDSPFASGTYQYFHLEDFEDGIMNTPGSVSTEDMGLLRRADNTGIPWTGMETTSSMDWAGLRQLLHGWSLQS